MKKLISLVLISVLIIIILTFLFTDREYLYLWKFHSNGKTVYLLGTVHAFNLESHSQIDRKIFNAFYRSDIILIEMIDAWDRQWSYHAGDSLKNHISYKDYQKLAKTLKENDLDLEDYHYYRPHFLLSALNQLSSVRYSYEQYFEKGIDFYFADKAVRRNIPIDALELFNYYAIYTEKYLSEEELGYYLNTEIRGIFERGIRMEEIITMNTDAWLGGYVKEIISEESKNEISLSDTEKEISESINKKFNKIRKDRNHLMVDRLEYFISKDDYDSIFAMAGLAHFILNDNIIDILSERGYKVRRIRKSYFDIGKFWGN